MSSSPLVAQLNQEFQAPGSLLGVLDALLTEALGSADVGRATAKAIVDGGFDDAQALCDLTMADMRELEIPAGRRRRVVRALFIAGELPSDPSTPAVVPVHHVSAGPPPVPPPQPPLATSHAPRQSPKSFKVAWPAAPSTGPSSAVWLDFGLALKSHLRDLPHDSAEEWATRVFKLFTAPWDDIPGSHQEGGDLDRAVCSALLLSPGGCPEWAAPLVRNHLSQDRGLLALQAVSRQLLTRTDVEDSSLKDEVRRPVRESHAHAVSRRLAQWDASLSGVELRGYTVDDQDCRAGLLRLVSQLDEFSPVVAALETSGSYTWQRLRAELGKVADRIKSSRQSSKAKANPAVARDGTVDLTALATRLGSMEKPLPRPKALDGRKLCSRYHRGLHCKLGSKCPDVHDRARRSFVAACMQFYDQGGDQRTLGRAVMYVVRQAAACRRLTQNSVEVLLSRTRTEVCRGRGGRSVACRSVSSTSGVRGALADTGASDSFLAGKRIRGRRERAAPRVVGTGNGQVVVDEVGSLGGHAGMLVNKYLLPDSADHLVSVAEVCLAHGCGYAQDPGNAGARFWHPSHPGEVVELVPDGRLFRVPPDAPTPSWVKSAAAVVHTAQPVTGRDGFWGAGPAAGVPEGVEPRWYRDHCARGHPFDPRCDHCRRGRMRQRPCRRTRRGYCNQGAGYQLSADLTGRHKPDVDGNTVALVVTAHCFGTVPDTEKEEAYSFTALLPKRTAKAVAEVLDNVEAELLRLGVHKDRVVARFHSDADRSFLSQVRKLAIRKGWSQTDTGGHRPKSNGRVERRIGQLKEQARSILLSCSGGVNYHEQLWGHALVQANYYLNRCPGGSGSTAYGQLTGRAYNWGERDRAFGELVLYHVPQHLRTDTYSPAGEYGIWLHRGDADSGNELLDPASVGGDVVAPIEWDVQQQGWIVYPTTLATTCRSLGCFPLRMRPGPGAAADPRRVTFSDFLDRAHDPLLELAAHSEEHAAAAAAGVRSCAGLSGGRRDGRVAAEDAAAGWHRAGSSGGQQEAAQGAGRPGRIRDSRQHGGVTQYLVSWEGLDAGCDSWVPADELAGTGLIARFRESLDLAVADGSVYSMAASAAVRSCVWGRSWSDGSAAMAAALGASDGGELGWDERAVDRLLQRDRALQGGVKDWLEPYRLEMASVLDRRLAELGPEEAARVRAEEKVPCLRMLLKRKRDGRHKARLVLQGFSEPLHWDDGRSNESPVATLSTVRMLLARSGPTDVITKRDISVAFLQSHGYGEDERKRYCSYTACPGAPTRYFRMLGPLYGQRSAPRRWYDTMSEWLRGYGLRQGCNEPCVFSSPDLTVVLYVDDLIVRGSPDATAAFHAALGSKDGFACTPYEELSAGHPLDFLGFTISKDVVGGQCSIYMDQEDSVREFLADFSSSALQLKGSPMPTKALFDSDDTQLSAADQAIYRHAVGSLNYFARTTRFDIGFATSRLSRKMACADVGAWKSLMHLLGYLKATLDFRIGGPVSARDDVFHYFVDSDHAGDRASDSRSQSGFMCLLNSFPIDWVSRRQPVTSVSPAEAEVYAMREVAVTGRWLQWVAEEMGIAAVWPLTI